MLDDESEKKSLEQGFQDSIEPEIKIKAHKISELENEINDQDSEILYKKNDSTFSKETSNFLAMDKNANIIEEEDEYASEMSGDSDEIQSDE